MSQPPESEKRLWLDVGRTFDDAWKALPPRFSGNRESEVCRYDGVKRMEEIIAQAIILCDRMVEHGWGSEELAAESGAELIQTWQCIRDEELLYWHNQQAQWLFDSMCAGKKIITERIRNGR